MTPVLLAGAALSAMVAIASDLRVRRRLFYLAKPLTTVLICAVAVSALDEPTPGYDHLISAGLVACLIGDIALLGRSTRAFIAGLCAFLFAHLLFALAIWLNLAEWRPTPWLLAVPVWMALAGVLTLPHARGMRIAVVVYGASLALLLGLAVLWHEAVPLAPQRAMLWGAALFCASDTLLGLRRFRWPEAMLQPAILSSYWIAIALIAASVPLSTLRVEGPDASRDVLAASTALDELSGIVPASRFDGWWGHNDGPDARLFAIGADGRDLGTVRIAGIDPVDIEDVAAWRNAAGRRLLPVGDIGDNWGRRAEVRLHALPEPDPGDEAVTPLWTLRVRYPDGPRDAEALAVDPREGRILILSKRDVRPRLYAVPIPDGDAEAVAEFVTEIRTIAPPDEADLEANPIWGLYAHWPSAMDVSPDGSMLLVVNYRSAMVWRRGPREGWAEALGRSPVPVPVPRLRQTEAGAFQGSRQIVIGSEGQPAAIALRPLPARLVR